MFRRAFTAAVAATALTAPVVAQKASAGQNCPEDAPCCGLYMDCGVGAFCVQGCDPVHSHSLEACVPNPQCKDATYNFNNLDDTISIDKYLGDASEANWVSQGKAITYQGNSILLTMAEGTVGTLLSSTHYVWYGKVCAKMTTSQGQGVVTAFILMSDAKDEIDFEFVGTDVNTAQSNFYSQGITDYTNGKNLPMGNTVEEAHDYCIDWTPDTLKWTIDGDEKRTINRKDTWNSTLNRFEYPQTPSRIMLSLWPAGLASNEEGTVEWAGGVIDWSSPYMQNGFYYARIEEVTVQCYDPPSGAKGSGSKSYVYNNRAATNATIELSNKEVILGSLYATGEDPEEGASSSSGAAAPTKSVNLVPGGNPGGGNRGEDVQTSAGAQATGGSNSPGGGGGGNSNGESSNPTGGQNFVQGGDQGGAGSTVQPGLGKVGGGAFAIVIAVLGLMIL